MQYPYFFLVKRTDKLFLKEEQNLTRHELGREGLVRKIWEWKEEYGAPDDTTIEDVTCDGCTSDGRHAGYCGECAVRACALERQVINCAYCADYGCEKLEGFLATTPEARATLEAVRASL